MLSRKDRQKAQRRAQAETMKLANATIDVDAKWLGSIGWLLVRNRCRGKFLSQDRQLAMADKITLAAENRGWSVQRRTVKNGGRFRLQVLLYKRPELNPANVW